MEAGKPASTPVALIRRCSWHDQETLLCDLSTVASTLAAAPNFTPPMISVVGEVIRMSKRMDWFSVRPWFGKRVWVTSPKATGNLLAKKLDEQGAMTVVEPVMTIQPPDDWAPVDAMILESGRFDWIVFSSVYGVDGFFARLKTLGKDGRLLSGAKIAAVGSATANAIAMHSMVCDVVPQAQGAEGIANLFEQNCRGKRFLFVRNPTGETIAMDRLRIAGAEVQSVSTYQQILKHELPSSVLKLLDTNQLDAVTATSKNIAKQAMELLGPSKTKVTWLSLSPSISDLLRQHGCEKILTAPEPSFEQLAALQC
jgi:uroporphyrinogen III methyltransferase/synthase